MRKGLLWVGALAVAMTMWTTGCTERKADMADTLTADTLISDDTTAVDTMERLLAEQPMPKAADELFDDFIFNFAASRKLQMERIAFPLPVSEGGETATVESEAWKTEHFFMDQGYYTLLLNDMKQVDATKDTSVDNVVVEKIYLNGDRIKSYLFERLQGLWTLVAVNVEALSAAPDATFLAFYRRFAQDADFQQASLHDPIMFTGPDPDDDFSTMTGEIAPESWPAFAPELPDDIIYNIVYGQRQHNATHKIMLLRGISNGLEMRLSFQRSDGAWKLTELTE